MSIPHSAEARGREAEPGPTVRVGLAQLCQNTGHSSNWFSSFWYTCPAFLWSLQTSPQAQDLLLFSESNLEA